MEAEFPFGNDTARVTLPGYTETLGMTAPTSLAEPADEIRWALENPIGTPPLAEITAEIYRVAAGHGTGDGNRPTAAVVISDNTRPVPYKGEAGILWPVIETITAAGFAPSNITVIIATGTHRLMAEKEIREMVDPRVAAAGVEIVNHDARDDAALEDLGKTRRGSRILIDRKYTGADLKILTGLVESHFMAGTSGGRKSICPGLMGVEGTHLFHGPHMLADEKATDLFLDGNPLHEESLETARTAGANFVLNVTLDHELRPTGVFGGELDRAHRAASEKLASYVGIPFTGEYDIVITHAGFVGINYYQVAKAAVTASRIVAPGGRILCVANNSDSLDPLGSRDYRMVTRLLKRMGPKAFGHLLQSPDWRFVPDQWEAQMWAKVYAKVPPENVGYWSPQFTEADYDDIPDTRIGPIGTADPGKVLTDAAAAAVRDFEKDSGRKPRIAWLPDGPYGIPVRSTGS